MKKTTEELAREAGVQVSQDFWGMLRLETFRRLCVENERECAKVHAWESDSGQLMLDCEKDPKFAYTARFNKPLFTFPPAAQVPEGWKLLKDTTMDERSWNEDKDHENGNYFCNCIHCGRQFIGHKWRCICKSCSMLAAAPEVKP